MVNAGTRAGWGAHHDDLGSRKARAGVGKDVPHCATVDPCARRHWGLAHSRLSVEVKPHYRAWVPGLFMSPQRPAQWGQPAGGFRILYPPTCLRPSFGMACKHPQDPCMGPGYLERATCQEHPVPGWAVII